MYACAKRRVRDDALAEDVEQAVFILFWRKRAWLGGEAKVTGWLYRAVGYCAANALRLKQIRQQHEMEAAMARLADAAPGEVQWTEVSPELERAVDRLSEKYRAAVLLRFYRQISFAEVGQSLGLSEEAARKRVDRALESLRGALAKKGVTAGAVTLGLVMAQNVTAAAPPGLADAATAAAVGGGAGAAEVIAKGAIKMMAWTKMKVAAMVFGAILVAGGMAAVLAQTSTTAPSMPVRSGGAHEGLTTVPSFLMTYRPLAVRVEGADVPSGLYVGVQEKQLNQTVDALAGLAPDGTAEKALGRFVHAIADNNQQEFAAITDLEGNAPVAAQLLTMYRIFITGAAKVQAVRSFAVGGATMFVLKGSERPDNPIIFLFASKNGKQVCSGKDFSHPVVQNLSTLARQIESHGDAYAATAQPIGRPLSITFDQLFGDDGRHPVVVCFNGYPLNYAVGAKNAPGTAGKDLSKLPADYAAAVRVYDEAVTSLARRDVAGYAARLGGEESRKWFADHISNKDRLDMMVGNHSGPRVVRYILGSPSMKVLVIQTGPGGGITLAELDLSVSNSYVHVVTQPDGKAAIVNMGQIAFIDSLLTWPDFSNALVKKYINAPEQGQQKRP